MILDERICIIFRFIYGLPFLENLIQLSGLGTDFKNLMALLSEILSATI